MTMTTAPAEMPAEMPTVAPVHPAPTVRAALEAARPTMAEIAQAIGVGVFALRAYFAGIRTPPAITRARLAVYLRGQAHFLEMLADKLDREAGP
jgi:hypothetical protein